MASPARGKGRGRGAVTLRQPISEEATGLRKPGVPPASERRETAQEKPLPPSLASVLKKSLGELLVGDKNAPSAAARFDECVTTPEDVDMLAERMISFCEEDQERARPLAVLCQALAGRWMDPSRVAQNPKCEGFRNRLLKVLGLVYEKRADMQKRSFVAFMGFASLLTYLFDKFRIKGEPPSFLAEPVTECLKDLLASRDGMDCFLELVEEVGQLVSRTSAPAMDKFCGEARRTVLAEKCPPWKRCVLLHVLELNAAGWKLPDAARKEYDSLIDGFRSMAVS